MKNFNLANHYTYYFLGQEKFVQLVLLNNSKLFTYIINTLKMRIQVSPLLMTLLYQSNETKILI